VAMSILVMTYGRLKVTGSNAWPFSYRESRISNVGGAPAIPCRRDSAGARHSRHHLVVRDAYDYKLRAGAAKQ